MPAPVVKKTKATKVVIDCSSPVADKVLAAADFKFLAEHIKIANKTNNLGDAVKVDVEGAKVIITTTVAFPKRYFKYLAKKYLKKNQLREYLRVIASSKAGYELRYFQLGGEGDEE